MFHQPSLRTPVWCMGHLDSYFPPNLCRQLHHSLAPGDLLLLGHCSVLEVHGDQAPPPHLTSMCKTSPNLSHLEYIFQHTTQAALLHMLQGPKKLATPPLPVAFLFFLHQCCGIVWYETTATCTTVRVSVSNKYSDVYSQLRLHHLNFHVNNISYS